MSDHTDILVQRVVQIQVPPEQEHAMHAADVAALPPGPEQIHARNAVFAEQTPLQGHVPSEEERQAALAMALLYAQQLMIGCAKSESRREQEPPRPRLEKEDDTEHA